MILALAFLAATAQNSGKPIPASMEGTYIKKALYLNLTKELIQYTARLRGCFDFI
jgi:hypothetical protein